MNEVSVSQQLARRDRHFLPAGNNPERANAAQAPAPLGANLQFDALGQVWQARIAMSERQNRFFSTRAALSTDGRAQSKFSF